MKAREVHKLGTEELDIEVMQLRRKLFELESQRVTERIQDTSQFNRIKKDLLKEMKQLQPGDGVLVVGNSSQPFLCTKKDEKAFVGFWDKHILLPIPDYDARRLLWQTLMRKHGAELPKDFDLPTLSQVSQGYCAGTINHVCRRILKPRKLEKLKEDPNALAVTEIVNQLCKLSPVSSDDISALEEWAKKLGPKEGKKKGK